MRLPRSNTALGLLGHELRVALRGWFGRRADGRRRSQLQLVIALAFLVFIAAVAGVPAGLGLRQAQVAPNPVILAFGAGAYAAVLTLMISQTLVAAVQALYDRGDLDLLLSSPTSVTRVIAVRALGMAVSASLVFVIFLTPVIVPVAVLAGPKWLSAYGVLVSLALFATSAGLLLALGMLSWLGPRRTKTFAQVAAALIGAGFFLVFQFQNITGRERAEGAWTHIARLAAGGDLRLPEFATWPARAVLGEPLPLLALLGASLAAFALAVAVAGRRFAADAAVAKGADAGPRRAGPRLGSFAGGAFQAVLRKELRLMLRDPALLSQVLLRVLYLLPLGFLVLRNFGAQREAVLTGAAAGIVFMAGQLGASLSWITVSAEDAPALLTLSPTPAGRLWRAKLAAAMLPLAGLLLFPLGALAYVSPPAALAAGMAAAGAGLSAGLINIWMQRPAKRQDLRRRRSASVAASIAELVTGILWAASAGLFISGFAWWASAVPALFAVAVLLALRRPEETILRRLAEAQ
ncbi:MAG TPA: hypothetical protein VF559_06320 [Caulobacteraceae bacterium]